MGEHEVNNLGDEARARGFMKALLKDVNALEAMLERGLLETGKRRIGAEQEMFLVDAAGRPANRAVEIMQRLNGHPNFTHELALFNLEANLTPHTYGGACLHRMEDELRELVGIARTAAREERCEVVLTGILPTLRKSDLGLASMTPNPRYLELNAAMTRLRGGTFQFKIKGIDELEDTHDNVMLESANTSFQVHFQVDPQEFARLYNLAQAITAPVLAVAVNSPMLLGQRLWQETRVALFQQSVDARSQAHQARGLRTRVSFGDAWVQRSVLEIFREDIARFRVVIACDLEEDPMEVLAAGGIPSLKALRLHNGTVYRWNRACYGIHEGKPHLRIENRVLPSGPTILDEVSNAAFYFGLMSGLANEYDDIAHVMPFDHAKENFHAAARHGLRAQFTWVDGNVVGAPELILEQLLPRARAGLSSVGIDAADIDRYLGCIEARVERRMTGARWSLESAAAMGGKATKDQIARTLVRTAIANQLAERPLHEWEFARPEDGGDWRHSYLKVGQFMTTDLFTVHPEDVVDLAASLMDWRHIRHVPVEDSEGQLVGLVSHRSLLRLVGQGLSGDKDRAISVKDIMKRDPVFVTPDTPTLEAIETMREHRVGSLPVVDKGRLVGIITERDLITVASVLFERHLRESSQE
ncbi:MAG: CBS domain-containing protein [Planctomycetes bacterium]|nr:CBS domain-containing protein [Planctomycetota bacterium]MCB9888999.1 CBS domain-containing protein [Planctomycetota bacterium]